jgi:hypothetical protein
MTSPLPNPESLHLCSICGKPLDLETCKADANGRAVHSKCIVGKLTTEKPPTKFY